MVTRDSMVRLLGDLLLSNLELREEVSTLNEALNKEVLKSKDVSDTITPTERVGEDTEPPESRK